MKKHLSWIGPIITLLGFILTLGAIGRIEQDACTWAQFFLVSISGLIVMGLGVLLHNMD